MLEDGQLVTGLAIVIASLVNMSKDDETPWYPIFIARSLIDVSFAGHTAAVMLMYPRVGHTWVDLVRLGLVAAVIIPWEYWS